MDELKIEKVFSELMIGLVAGTGSNLTLVIKEIRKELKEYGYKCCLIKMSDLAKLIEGNTYKPKLSKTKDAYIVERMDKCNSLRKDTENKSILASLVIVWINRFRKLYLNRQKNQNIINLPLLFPQ